MQHGYSGNIVQDIVDILKANTTQDTNIFLESHYIQQALTVAEEYRVPYIIKHFRYKLSQIENATQQTTQTFRLMLNENSTPEWFLGMFETNLVSVFTLYNA